MIESAQMAEENANFMKIKLRLEQTQRNNKLKPYCNKFLLRNCRMSYLPVEASRLLSKSEHLLKLKQLDLSEMDLRSLANLPNFAFLTKLNLIMNFITDSEIRYIFKYTTLQVLYLSQNFIQNLQTVKSLSALPSLKEIDLTSNPVKYDRADLFRTLKLKVIDRYSASGLDLERNRLFNDNNQNGESSQSGEDSPSDCCSDQMSDEDEDLYEESDIILRSASLSDQENDWTEQKMQNQCQGACSQKIEKRKANFQSQQSEEQKNMVEQEQEEKGKAEQSKQKRVSWKGIFDSLI